MTEFKIVFDHLDAMIESCNAYVQELVDQKKDSRRAKRGILTLSLLSRIVSIGTVPNSLARALTRENYCGWPFCLRLGQNTNAAKQKDVRKMVTKPAQKHLRPLENAFNKEAECMECALNKEMSILAKDNTLMIQQEIVLHQRRFLYSASCEWFSYFSMIKIGNCSEYYL
uniref:Uncharacterized protein n=1 Tax=Romanomermis culicivorax TaxID=13658 RepID=A0A915KCY8_ROMCU